VELKAIYKENTMDKWGKTKLDHWLSYASDAFGTMLKWGLIVGLPVIIIEQICIWATNLIQSWIF